MARNVLSFCFFFIVCGSFSASAIVLVVPEDVPMGFATIFGFTPKILTGTDNRFGFGFRFGNHADLQVLYEFGPQQLTRPLPKPITIRSATYSQRIVKRRPLLEFLLNLGILKQVTYRYDVQADVDSRENDVNEPR